MAIIVIGGHSRSVGKTSVVAGLIAALPEFHWTAIKITQYGHGICSANGELCDCATDDHTWAVTEERDRSGESDTSRFLVSGAARSLWVRTRQGMLAEAMPRVREELAGADNAILESNSADALLAARPLSNGARRSDRRLQTSAQEFLDRADAVILHDGSGDVTWTNVSLKPVAAKPIFRIRPPLYVTPELIEFVRNRVQHRGQGT